MPGSRPPSPASLRQRHLRAVLFGALALTVAGVLATTGFSIWRLRVEAIANAFEIASMNARGLEDHLTQNLRTVELAANAALPADLAAVQTDGGRLSAEILSHAPFLRSLSLADAMGRIVSSSNPANVGEVVPAKGFLPPTDSDVEILRVGPAWAGRDLAGGRPATVQEPIAPDDLSFVPLLRNYRRTGGSVTLLATVNPDYFINHFERALVATGGSAEVVRYDGSLLLSTDRNARPGTADHRLATLMQAGEAVFGRSQDEMPDGRVVLTSFRVSRVYPVAVVTRLDRDAVLAHWRADAFNIAGVVAPMLAAVSLLALAFYRRQSQLIAERAAAERLTRLNSTVFESSTDAILITDPEARIVSVNPAFTRICGYAADEVIGRNPKLLSSGLQGKAFYDQMWQKLLDSDAWHGEIVNQRKDGSLYTAQLSITAFRRPDGELLHFIGVSSDITERKRQEARIDELNRTLAQRVQEAEAANRAKSTFLANMSHELRTPLHAIMGMADLVQRATADPKQRGRLDKIKKASMHLVEIISDILDISRIEAEKLGLEREALRLRDILDNVLSLVGQRAAEKGLALTVDIDPGLAERRLWGDPLRLSQVLVNLVGNAVKFTAQGSVAVRIAQTGEGAGEVRLRCEVTDTGIGIQEQDLPNLFQAFAQVDDSMTRAYGGTGLGLAISRSLVHLMGGEIGVDSRPGAGSTFWFTCRLGEAGAQESLPRHDPQADLVEQLREDLAGTRILLAEDDALNREVALEFLEQLSATVHLAGDGRQAVDLARCNDYDIVLMDMNMPRMNGIDATVAIRAIPGRERLPVLAMTANAFDGDRQRCLAAGMNDILVKPVGRDQLLMAIAHWLGPRD